MEDALNRILMAALDYNFSLRWSRDSDTWGHNKSQLSLTAATAWVGAGEGQPLNGQKNQPCLCCRESFDPNTCSNRHSSCRASLGRLPGKARLLHGKHRKKGGEQRAGETQNWQEVLALLPLESKECICATCHGGWHLSALNVQLSCRILRGVPWGGTAAGQRGEGTAGHCPQPAHQPQHQW